LSKTIHKFKVRLDLKLTAYELATLAYVASIHYSEVRKFGVNEFSEALRKLRNRLQPLALKAQKNEEDNN